MYDNFDIHAAAESIPLTVSAATEKHAAARMTARHARDKADLAELLAALALPDDVDTITTLLPLIPDPTNDSPAEPEPTGDEPAMPDQTPATPATGLNAFEAMAISMHKAGDDIPAITEATGMSQQEVEDLLTAHTDTAVGETASPAGEAEAPAEPAGSTSIPAATAPDVADVDVLLLWAQQHPLASVRATAGRIRQDLADLNQRRVNEQAATEVEARIAKLRAELQAEEDRLRQLKVGIPHAAGTIGAPTPLRHEPAKRSRKDLAAIRSWARENGHQVGVAGVIKASIVAAYDAAHQQPATLAKAG
ncbi:Lsr2 dimerization domain-containing protein [Streptomyces sp. NRRL F-5123]|uniref:Lsr2 family DNA-binding protein n=1 Tax=Streptomyces sp. NRRL F-5123 TaxID=1463856 RepID=UPI0004E1E4A3|nr:histone-like nucleoid-structuring protein Lsr2 [Streptomyces sp. NRRL F-5123]